MATMEESQFVTFGLQIQILNQSTQTAPDILESNLTDGYSDFNEVALQQLVEKQLVLN